MSRRRTSSVRRTGPLALAVAATVAVNTGLILLLVELSRPPVAAAPMVASPLTVRPPPPPPPTPQRPPSRPTPRVAPAPAPAPSPPTPALALAPVATQPLGLPAARARVDPTDLPALALPTQRLSSLSAASAGPAPDHAAELVFAPDLEAFYPPPARQRKTEGRTRLRLQLDARGAVQHIEIVESAPVGVFEDAARAAARRLRYRPARRDGRPVPSAVTLVLRWSLR